MLVALVLLHVVVGLGVFGTGRRLGRRAFMVVAVAPVCTLVYLATQLDRLTGDGDAGRALTNSFEWIPALGVQVSLRLDAFGLVMAALVSVIGVLVYAYSTRYFHSDDPGLARLAGLLSVFAGAMLGVVMADDLITLFAAWELTSITSYLLIGNDYTKSTARAAALHALLITSMGGLVMLAGIVLIGQAAGTFRLSEILSAPPSGTTVTAGLVCVAIGAFTKSAQYPFASWLPGAMAAPTPVSAYLHSATMVKAGVYLLGRFAPVFATVGVWRPLVLTVGLATMIFGALRALRQYDLKLLLAHGTVSQLGFLVVLFGAGVGSVTQAAVLVIIAHALFKAALFFVVGIIDHQAGTRDIRLLPPLRSGWVPVKAIAIVSAASMAGIPLVAGFVAKEAAYTAFVDGTFPGGPIVLAGLVIGSALTMAYSLRFVWGITVLPGRLRAGTEQVSVRHPAQAAAAEVGAAPRPSWAFVAPGAVLAALTVIFGVLPSSEDDVVSAATFALDPVAHPEHLALWHGLNLPLLLTLVTFCAGGALFALRRPLARVLRVGDFVPNGTEVYLTILQGLNRVATRTTAIVQNGSLPIYAGVVIGTAAVLPGYVLVTRVEWPGLPAWLGSAFQVPITLMLIGGALLAAAVRRRFTAVLFLSVVGYGMAALFVVQGAPDLALTQAAIETLSTVLFVLVLRKLPDRFERTSSPFTRSVRVAVSVTIGLMVFAFAIIARDARQVEPVSSQMVEMAYPEAKGRNVVNVILVDFRGFDTMGEITVLAAAAIGCVALARAGRRRDSLPPVGDTEQGP